MSDFSFTNRFTPVNPAYPSCERVFASLRVYPQVYTIEEVSAILSSQPNESVRIGDPIGTRGKVATKTYWSISSEERVKSLDLRDHLDWLLSQFNLDESAKRKLELDRNLRLCVFCVSWSRSGSGGPSIWPEQMSELARRDLELTIDFNIYQPEN
jgi:hypothetical protein